MVQKIVFDKIDEKYAEHIHVLVLGKRTSPYKKENVHRKKALEFDDVT